MHPVLCEAMMAARRREIEAAGRRPGPGPAPRRGTRRPARVAVGMRLIGLGLRLVDVAPAG